MFKVGDIIVGTSTNRYLYTTKGVVGVVTSVRGRYFSAMFSNLGYHFDNLDEAYFKKVIPTNSPKNNSFKFLENTP